MDEFELAEASVIETVAEYPSKVDTTPTDVDVERSAGTKEDARTSCVVRMEPAVLTSTCAIKEIVVRYSVTAAAFVSAGNCCRLCMFLWFLWCEACTKCLNGLSASSSAESLSSTSAA